MHNNHKWSSEKRTVGTIKIVTIVKAEDITITINIPYAIVATCVRRAKPPVISLTEIKSGTQAVGTRLNIVAAEADEAIWVHVEGTASDTSPRRVKPPIIGLAVITLAWAGRIGIPERYIISTISVGIVHTVAAVVAVDIATRVDQTSDEVAAGVGGRRVVKEFIIIIFTNAK